MRSLWRKGRVYSRIGRLAAEPGHVTWFRSIYDFRSMGADSVLVFYGVRQPLHIDWNDDSADDAVYVYESGAHPIQVGARQLGLDAVVWTDETEELYLYVGKLMGILSAERLADLDTGYLALDENQFEVLATEVKSSLAKLELTTPPAMHVHWRPHWR